MIWTFKEIRIPGHGSGLTVIISGKYVRKFGYIFRNPNILSVNSDLFRFTGSALDF